MPCDRFKYVTNGATFGHKFFSLHIRIRSPNSATHWTSPAEISSIDLKCIIHVYFIRRAEGQSRDIICVLSCKYFCSSMILPSSHSYHHLFYFLLSFSLPFLFFESLFLFFFYIFVHVHRCFYGWF